VVLLLAKVLTSILLLGHAVSRVDINEVPMDGTGLPAGDLGQAAMYKSLENIERYKRSGSLYMPIF